MLLPLCSTVWSFERISSTLFPLYLLLGMARAEGRRTVPISAAVVEAAAALAAMAAFGAGWWVN